MLPNDFPALTFIIESCTVLLSYVVRKQSWYVTERYKSCTVLFSDIVTFTDIASKCTADDIVNMLNDLYHRFDKNADFYDVYKVSVV